MTEREKVIHWLEASLMLADDAIEKGTLPNNAILVARQYFADALALLKDPDWVRVVRCRDCESWWPDTNEEKCSSGLCRNQFGVCGGQTTDMNWFCADGEREG